MKDLRARSNILLVFLAVAALLGCQSLNATKPASQQNSAELTSAVSHLEFGSVVIGYKQTLANEIVNNSNSAVTLTAARVDQPDFSLSAKQLPLTLAPGETAALTVNYQPKAHGTSTGTVTLADASTTSSTSFSVSGTATSAGKLSVAPSTISFGTVGVGQNQKVSASVTNTGGSDVTITQASISGNGFSLSGLTLPITLHPSSSVPFTVVFAPASGGPVNGSISLVGSVAVVTKKGKGHRTPVTTDTVSTTQTVPCSGTGMMTGQLTVSPGTVSLGSVQVGAIQSQSATLTNATQNTVNVSGAAITGAGLTMSGITLPLSLSVGQSLNFSITFAPQTAGAINGNVAFTSDAPNPSLNLPITATAMVPGSLISNPSTLSFSTVPVGATQTLSATLTNSGGSSVSVSNATLTGTGFTMSGLSMPVTLAAGQSKTFGVTFKPQTSGQANGHIAISSNAANASLGIDLSGSAQMPGTLVPASSSISFGSVPVGTSQNQPETLTNSGASTITLSQAAVTGTGFGVSGLSLPLTLAPGQSVNFSLSFSPASGGSKSGTLNLASDASNSSLAIPLSGSGQTPGMLAASSSSLNFGGVAVGNNASQSETLTNTGGANVNLSAANLTGGAFGISGLNLPMTLVPGQSFTFGITFTPPSGGSATGNIAIASDAANATLNILLSGSGTVPGQLGISPAALDFGSVVVGQSKSLDASLTATGSNVIVSSAGMSTSEFSLSGVSFPLTVAAGQSVSVHLTFTPQSSGSASANLSFASNATNSTLSEALTGTGTPAPQHNVTLNWSESGSGAVGYNVYRGNTQGGPYSRLNSAMNSSTSFVDDGVQAGSTYFYVTTAVSSTGTESTYSNQVKAVIPTP